MRVSPRKMRLVVDMVRGRDVEEAIGLLRFMPNKSAVEVLRTIKAAQANAENNYDLDPDDLWIKAHLCRRWPDLQTLASARHGGGLTRS